MEWKAIEAEADFTGLTNLGSLTFDYSQPAGEFSGAYIEGAKVKFGNANIKHSLVGTHCGTVIFPALEITSLVTYIQDGCNNCWTTEGHSHLHVMANEVLDGCNIVANGGDETASVTIDFDYDNGDASCRHNNTVTLEASGSNTIITVTRPQMFGDPHQFTVTASDSYRNFVTIGSNCDDTVQIVNTLGNAKTVTIETGGGVDTVRLGSSTGGMSGIHADVFVFGGEGSGDELIVDDADSEDAKMETLTSTFVHGVLPHFNQTLQYEQFEVVTLMLTSGKNTLGVSSTSPGSFTTITTGGGADVITVNTTQGDIEINCGG